MTDRDTRYLLRPGERTTVAVPDRTLRVARAHDEVLGPLREPAPRTPPLRFGDIELEIERDGNRVVLWVVDMPLLCGSIAEATRLTEVLRSIIGRP